MKKFFAVFIILILAAVAVVLVVRAAQRDREPTPTDQFAQCITDSGATFYGAYWCPHCMAQKQMFGRAQKLLPYVECSTPNRERNATCTEADIQSYPTWEFADGTRLSGERSFAELSEATSCPLPEETNA